MSYLDYVISFLLFICFVAHFFVGTKESLATQDNLAAKNTSNWVQLFNCWHLVSVDLLIYTLISFALAAGLLAVNEFRLFIAIVFSLYMISWLLTLVILKKARYLKKEQPHPFMFLVIAGLSYWSYINNLG